MIETVFAAAALLFGAIMIMFPLFSYREKGRKAKEERYSLLRYFPCEMAKDYRQRAWLVILGMAFAACGSETYALAIIPSRTVLYYSGMIMQILSLLGFLGSVFFTLEYYRPHLVADAVFFLGQIGGDAALALAAILNNGLRYDFSKIVSLVMGILGILLLIAIFLPQLKKWMMLEKSEENGKVIYVRPKISFLAFVEWIFFFGQLANILMLLLSPVFPF